MAGVTEELKRRKTTDSAEQTGESKTVQKGATVQQGPARSVQTGKLSDADRTKLVKDPRAGTGASGGGKHQRRVENYLAATKGKPVPKTPAPSLEQGNVARKAA
ncbi:MAG: hypothetical protein GX262_13115, partial [Clostridia bacterium]|nr:hypothetical protein [Clostridia bacterium]